MKINKTDKHAVNVKYASTATRLRKLRRDKELTILKLGGFLGIQPSSYHNYERGVVLPPPEKLEKLADLFLVSTDYLLGKTDDPTPTLPRDGWMRPEAFRVVLTSGCRRALEHAMTRAGDDLNKLATISTALDKLWPVNSSPTGGNSASGTEPARTPRATAKPTRPAR